MVNEHKETPDILKKYQNNYNDALDFIDASNHSLMVVEETLPKSPLEKQKERMQRRKETKAHLANGGTAQDFEQVNNTSDLESKTHTVNLEDIPFEQLSVEQKIALMEKRKQEREAEEQERQKEIQRQKQLKAAQKRLEQERIEKERHEQEEKGCAEKEKREQEEKERAEKENQLVVIDAPSKNMLVPQTVKPKKDGFFSKLKRFFMG